MRIERALEADIPALLSLLQSLFAIEKDFTADAQRQQRGLQALLRAPEDRAALLVARAGDAVLGMASGQLVISTAQGAPSVWVEDVIVAQEARGKGIGRALLNAIVAWARSKGATRAQLLADRNNSAALSFYAHYGLESTDLVALRLRDLDRLVR
jgi:GNAT superfamily N-acetyltransferase